MFSLYQAKTNKSIIPSVIYFVILKQAIAKNYAY